MALSLNRFHPFFPLSSFDKEMRSLLQLADRMDMQSSEMSGTTCHVPNYEYQRDNNGTYLQVELPGVAKKHIEVEIKSGRLTITARRFRAAPTHPFTEEQEQSTEQKEANDANNIKSATPSHVYKLEVSVGTNVNEEGIKAEYNDGVLSMTFPPKKMHTARKIAIADQ